MNTRRWIWVVVLGALVTLPACSTGGVTYVDEAGNVLAVDDSGQPVLPGRSAPAAAPMIIEETAPATVAAARAAASSETLPALPTSASAGSRKRAEPAPDPSWGVAPASTEAGFWIEGGDFQPAAGSAKPTLKKVGSSAALEDPPAGSEDKTR